MPSSPRTGTGPGDARQSRPVDSADRTGGAGGDGGADEPLWTRNDALVTSGACAMNLLSYVFSAPLAGHEVSVAGFLLVALTAVPLLARRRHPAAALTAVLALDATAALTVPLPSHFGAVLVVALYSVARTCSGRVTAVAAVATVAVTLLSQGYGGIPPWQEAVSAPLSTLFVVGAALAVNRWQREVAANRRLLADRAVADERRRIARELHDIVAHHITTMQLMAGGARANIDRPEVVRDALVTLEGSGRLALREMRQLLDVLRAGDEPEAAPSTPQPGADDLDRLVAESRLAGLPTDFTVHGPKRPLPPTAGLTVFRIVQEALTNARKYAGDARATVRLTYREDGVTVEVRDDGGSNAPQDGPPPGGSGGYGLIGMRERVALHGGTLAAGPRADGGFGVLAELPLTPDRADETALPYAEARR
ncbi:sensor histidine kinase [Streptomyces sp. NPDC014894]|uniref:sensor histidine kinase n=1 Tax=Streptomyces sp. NPDC014894 TaxID=3364931 RepID=UPI0036FEF617